MSFAVFVFIILPCLNSGLFIQGPPPRLEAVGWSNKTHDTINATWIIPGEKLSQDDVKITYYPFNYTDQAITKRVKNTGHTLLTNLQPDTLYMVEANHINEYGEGESAQHLINTRNSSRIPSDSVDLNVTAVIGQSLTLHCYKYEDNDTHIDWQYSVLPNRQPGPDYPIRAAKFRIDEVQAYHALEYYCSKIYMRDIFSDPMPEIVDNYTMINATTFGGWYHLDHVYFIHVFVMIQPDAATDFKCSGTGDRSITISWKHPNSQIRINQLKKEVLGEELFNITQARDQIKLVNHVEQYRIEFKRWDVDSDWADMLVPKDQNQVEITDLTPGNRYNFRLVSINRAGESEKIGKVCLLPRST